MSEEVEVKSKKAKKKWTIDEQLRKEEALHFFVRNRQAEGKAFEAIKNEWAELATKFEDDRDLLEQTFKAEKLKLLVLSTRQSLNYSKSGIESAMEREYKPFI